MSQLTIMLLNSYIHFTNKYTEAQKRQGRELRIQVQRKRTKFSIRLIKKYELKSNQNDSLQVFFIEYEV